MNKGLIYVITGEGKGKTTAAFGLALRAAGHNLKSLIIQFIKGPWKSGEVKFIEQKIPEIDIFVIGRGFIKQIDNEKSLQQHRTKAEQAFYFMAKRIKTKKYDILILDEINVAINLGLLPVKNIVEFLQNKPKKLHVVLTGRNADKKIIKIADMVSEIKNHKHPFVQGILAQKGIDF